MARQRERTLNEGASRGLGVVTDRGGASAGGILTEPSNPVLVSQS